MKRSYKKLAELTFSDLYVDTSDESYLALKSIVKHFLSKITRFRFSIHKNISVMRH